MNWELQEQKLASIRKGEWLMYWNGPEQWTSFVQSADGISAKPFQAAIEKAIDDRKIVTVQERHGENKYVYWMVGI